MILTEEEIADKIVIEHVNVPTIIPISTTQSFHKVSKYLCANVTLRTMEGEHRVYCGECDDY